MVSPFENGVCACANKALYGLNKVAVPGAIPTAPTRPPLPPPRHCHHQDVHCRHCLLSLLLAEHRVLLQTLDFSHELNQ